MELAQLQSEYKVWSDRNFPNETPEDQLIGALEELGELAHANLKGRSRIREGANARDVLRAKERDAVGDVVIYLMGYCLKRGFSIAECVADAWDEVKHRDWVANPVDGRGTLQGVKPEKIGYDDSERGPLDY